MSDATFFYRPKPDDGMRMDQLYFAVDRCDVGIELAKRVYFLGRPAFTSRPLECPTSCVRCRPNGGVIFQFNRDFFDSLGGEEIAFVTLHEALHIVFRHAERRGERDPMIWNVACDIVINELLLQQPTFANNQSEGFKKLIAGAATFARFRDYLVHVGPPVQLSSEAIYDRLTRHPQLKRWVNKIIRELRPFHVDMYLEGAGRIHGHSAWAREMVARRLDNLLHGQVMRGWSMTESGELRQVDRATAPRVPWDQLLFNRVASLFDEQSWESWQPARRLAALYPDVLLPAERELPSPRKVNLLVAIDASGSIDRAELEKLVAVTRSIPRERAEITAISFDVRAYPFELDKPETQPRGGGGTNFVCIEDHAAAQAQYPDLVVVLTDGAGAVPTPRLPNRWLWVLTPGGIDIHVHEIGRVAWM